MDENIFDNIQDVDLKKTMEESYISYAMSVIAARALPDVRDGLKPVQRRILYAMIELNNGPDKPHRKCARIVGDTMGKYHPHGDSSIYGALVNLAQDWSTRYPLVDGHGNFGSVDGDGAAAMRYTEARLSKISMEMLSDIKKDTVDFIPNFDETEKEPVVLPSRFPNLLVNGTTGIAVGMATNIPPHNLREVIGAVQKIIDNRVEEDRETSIEEILQIVKGPDFPTAATILGTRGIEEAYRTGRGKIRVRAVADIEPMQGGKSRIVVTELPYLVNKSKLIERIAELSKEKKLDGITDLRDESDREGMRICIELRKDVNPNVMLNLLYKHTEMQTTFGVNMLALVNNEPKTLSLIEMLTHYLAHQEDVVTRRTKYNLDLAEKTAHIKEALIRALDVIDQIIALIRSSKNKANAKERLMAEFGFDDPQAQAIIDMTLGQLTNLERENLEREYAALMEKIAGYKAILADEKVLLGVIREEIGVIAAKFGDERRTAIGYDEFDISMEDIIPDDNTVVAMTKLGYVKRMTIDNFKNQHRGGKGIKGMAVIEDDYIEELFMTTNHHYLMFFTDRGRVYRLKAYEIPEASRTARGTAIINLLQLQGGEKITAAIDIRDAEQEGYLFMVTKMGIVKKTKLTEYANIRKNGLQAINLRDDDELITVKFTDGNKDILMVTRDGMSIRFNEKDVRQMGRATMGVIGMNIDEDVVVSAMTTDEGEYLLTISESGLGKRTHMDEFPVQHRGGKGIKCYKLSSNTGNVVGAMPVGDDDEIMLINNEGTVIRMKVDGISIIGRNTSGVKLFRLEDNSTVSSFTKVLEGSRDIDNPEESEELMDSETAEASESDAADNMEE